jgi:NAD(P)-dependent dehydrogenase (short-subunit alcohol dehydrogenase family)
MRLPNQLLTGAGGGSARGVPGPERGDNAGDHAGDPCHRQHQVHHVDGEKLAGGLAGRWGRPEEIAHLAVFLANDDADFIHGSAFTVDGGWLLS